MKNSGKTDWKRVNNLTDKTIDYSDIPDTSFDFWEDAAISYPVKKVTLKLKVDEDIAEWIKQLGSNSDVAINNLLRSYYIGSKNISKPFTF